MLSFEFLVRVSTQNSKLKTKNLKYPPLDVSFSNIVTATPPTALIPRQCFNPQTIH